ncbi:uncharacterized protein LOC102459398 [Pelodiscus sinensis]|uniref:uncharacterized protein LOC102459398 n=1 Tax=Pelodiscus sinensis TaxID=13735 RepID=UPI003F6D2411
MKIPVILCKTLENVAGRFPVVPAMLPRKLCKIVNAAGRLLGNLPDIAQSRPGIVNAAVRILRISKGQPMILCMTTVKNLGETVVPTPVSNVGVTVIPPVTNLVGNVVTPVSNLVGNVVTPVSNLVENVATPVSNLVGNVVTPVSNLVENVATLRALAAPVGHGSPLLPMGIAGDGAERDTAFHRSYWPVTVICGQRERRSPISEQERVGLDIMSSEGHF